MMGIHGGSEIIRMEKERMARKSTRSKREMRNLRMQQYVAIAIGVIVILAMVLSLIAK